MIIIFSYEGIQKIFYSMIFLMTQVDYLCVKYSCR